MRAFMSSPGNGARRNAVRTTWSLREKPAVALSVAEASRILAVSQPFAAVPCPADFARYMPFVDAERTVTPADILTEALSSFLLSGDQPTQPAYTDCGNCGTVDHGEYACPCGCHRHDDHVLAYEAARWERC